MTPLTREEILTLEGFQRAVEIERRKVQEAVVKRDRAQYLLTLVLDGLRAQHGAVGCELTTDYQWQPPRGNTLLLNKQTRL